MKTRKLSGIDLLKTLAIIAVVVYHVDVKLLPGGFIGVDLFFVISGYLLAHSLVRNQDKSLRRMLSRRFMQLWPALLVLVFVTMLFITLFNERVLHASNIDGVSSIFFLTNWSLIFNNVGYFDSFIVNPFKHLWYIAVLMQSSILITVLFKGFIQFNIKKYNVFVMLMIGIGIGSLVLQQLLYDPTNVSRVYYGTDTRIFAIILGVLGYFVYPMTNLQKKKPVKEVLAINVLGILSLALLAFLMFRVSEADLWIYRFGFLLFAANSLALIITIGSYNNIISLIFDKLKFLLFPGKLSYGIYLWHYPILVLSMTIHEIVAPNKIFTAIRLITTLLIAFLSYRFLEKPFSSGEYWKNTDREAWKLLFTNLAIYPLIVIFLMGSFGFSMPFLSTAFLDTSRDINIQDELIADGIDKTPTRRPVEPKNNNDTNNDNVNNDNTNTETTNEEMVEDTNDLGIDLNNPPELRFKKLVLIGDSTAVYPGQMIINLYPNSVVDAKISRQLVDSVEVVQKYAKHDGEDTAVVFMLGSNGIFTNSDLDNLVSVFPKSQKVFINVKVPDTWEQRVNELISEYANTHDDVDYIDWYTVASNNPEYLASDATHLMQEGVATLVRLIIAKLQ